MEFAGLTGVRSRVAVFTVDSFTVLIFELRVSSGLKYIRCTISLLTKTRRQNTEIPWRPVLDFPVEPGAKINQPWGKYRPALTYGKMD